MAVSNMNQDDRAKFDVIVKPHLLDAFGLAHWLAGSRSEAEDIVQDACLRAFQAIHTFSGGSARAWVLTIVRRATRGSPRTAYPGLLRCPILTSAIRPRPNWAETGTRRTK